LRKSLQAHSQDKESRSRSTAFRMRGRDAVKRIADLALQYARAGLPVFPCSPQSKQPCVAKREGGKGFKDATTDETIIRAWWTRWPHAMIGMPTGPASGVISPTFRPASLSPPPPIRGSAGAAMSASDVGSQPAGLLAGVRSPTRRRRVDRGSGAGDCLVVSRIESA
jgi:hypothetical protein